MIENLTIRGLCIESANHEIGGIAGCNAGVIEACTVSEGRISGGMYTGGITGYQSDGRIIDCSYRGTLSAWGYGGGIAGIALKSAMIKDCDATAAVYAKEGYGGGIVGYNEGIVENSTFFADFKSSEGTRLLEKIAENGPSGDYIGGIAGYNAGRLISETEVIVTPAVFGRNYTGGIVGFNAPGAFVGEYVLEGGYIKGRACVGGLVGFNGSELFLSEAVHTAKPQNIYGDFYVGSIIGANAVETQKALELVAEVDSEEGTITAYGICVGGLIGYNVLLNPNAVSETELVETSDFMALRLVDMTYDASHTTASAQKALENLNSLKVAVSPAVLNVKTESEICLDEISGGLYVGGLIGYQQAESVLTVSDVTVNTSVRALITIDRAGIQTAFSGILMGHVPQNTTLYGCSAAETAKLFSNADILGILAEINEGCIKSCESAGADMSMRGGVGGIVGLNASDRNRQTTGKLMDCTLNGELLAKERAGGMAVINQGEIFGCVISGNVTASGNTVGGIAAINEGSISAFNEGDQESLCKIEADISGGNYVGGAAGINNGAVSGCEISAKGLLDSRRSIQGEDYVGGFIGWQKDCTGVMVQKLILPSYVDVTGKDCVGGIVGKMSGRAIYDACESFGSITAQADMAGGIAGSISRGAIVRGCRVSALELLAPNADYIGGIAGFNAGEIENCTVSGDTKLTGIWRVGGIAGQNSGNIKVCTVSQIQLILKENTAGSCVGGIAGQNYGNIENSAAQQSTKTEKRQEIHVQSWVDGSYMGGIAGKNSGKIISTNASIKINVGAVLTFLNDAGGMAGGIAGENTGDIRYYRFTGQIKNDGKGTVYAGGIAGVNGNSDGVAAYIDSCYVYDRVLNSRALTAENKADNAQSTTILASSKKSMAGGIVGVNYKNAYVKASVPVKCYIVSDGALLGGIAGYNSGVLMDCRPDNSGTDGDIRVKLYSAGGVTGAISGKSDTQASESGCISGSSWYFGGSH